jgi:membrane-associated phospholipid phosphatase
MRQGVKFPAAAALACVLGLALLMVGAYWVGPLPQADVTALNGLEALQGPVATPALYGIVHTADPVPIALMLAAILGVGVSLGRRRQAVMALIAVAGANLAAEVLKLGLAHPRLHPIDGVNHVWSTAFPSGHATGAMSIALAAVIVSPPRVRARVAALAGLYALAVGTALPIIGWHFPSDVLGGFLVAAAFAFGTVAVGRELAGRDAPPERPVAFRAPSRAVLLGAAGALTLVTLARHDDLVAYVRYHTAGVAVVLALSSACALLIGTASRLADR